MTRRGYGGGILPPPPSTVGKYIASKGLSLFIGEELLQLPIGLYVFANFKIILENATLFFHVVREGNDNSKVIFCCYTSPHPPLQKKQNNDTSLN